MESSDAVLTSSVALFESTCEALDVPVGAQRLEAFLKLPRPQQDAILNELAIEAKNPAVDEGIS